MPKPPNVAAIQEAIFAPVAGAGALLAVGLVGLVSGLPLLFPGARPIRLHSRDEPGPAGVALLQHLRRPRRCAGGWLPGRVHRGCLGRARGPQDKTSCT